MSNRVASPIDPALLAPALDPSLAGARTLPAEAYTSGEVLAWERRWFFEGSWVCVGRADSLGSALDRSGASGRVTEWMGWVFVNADGEAPAFYDYVGNLGELIEPWQPERCFTADVHEYRAKANWKTIAENYQECYHCPSIHPALCKVTPVDSGEYYQHTGAVIGGSMELMDFAETMSMTGESRGVRFLRLSAKQLREVYYYGVFPNLLISLHPDYIMTHRLNPLAPGETFIECSFLFPPEAKEIEGFDPSYATEFWDLTNREDFAACESVFRGLTSLGYRQGPFAGEEDEVHAFMHMVARGYLDGRVTKAPELHGGTRPAELEPARAAAHGLAS